MTAIVDPLFGTQSFRYDALDRLISATRPYGTGGATSTRTYGYDPIGNLILHCTLGDLAYPTSGVGSVRPHAVCATGTTSCASPTYQYDLNGNLTSNPNLSSLVYDFENRPTSIAKAGGSTTTMTYSDLLGRVTKTASGSTTTYAGPFYECTGGSCTKYIFAGDQRIALKQASTVTYAHADHLSSSSVLTNGSDGSKTEQVTYYPFGQTRTDTDGAGNPISPGFRYKYTDQEFDDTTGLYYYQARYYDPVLGRFIQPDPLVPDLYDPQSLNPYSYVLNNPLRYTDPTGLQQDPIQLQPITITASPLFLYPGLYQFGTITTPVNPALFSFAPGAATVTPRVEVFAPSTGQGFTMTAGVTTVVTAQATPVSSPFPSISLPQVTFFDVASLALLPVGLARAIAGQIIGRDPQSLEPISGSELLFLLGTQGKLPPGLGGAVSKALTGVKFLSVKELARRLGVSQEAFHRSIKPAIIRDFPSELKNLGTENPDIGINQAGNLVLRDPRSGRTVGTDVPLQSYLP